MIDALLVLASWCLGTLLGGLAGILLMRYLTRTKGTSK